MWVKCGGEGVGEMSGKNSYLCLNSGIITNQELYQNPSATTTAVVFKALSLSLVQQLKARRNKDFKKVCGTNFLWVKKGVWRLHSIPLALPGKTASLDKGEVRPSAVPPPLLHLFPGCPSRGTQQQILNEPNQAMRQTNSSTVVNLFHFKQLILMPE